MKNEILKYDYKFDELKNHIVSTYSISDWFSFCIYSNHEPYVGDKILINNHIFVVDSVSDDTDDEEMEQGLSYSKVYVSKI